MGNFAKFRCIVFMVLCKLCMTLPDDPITFGGEFVDCFQLQQFNVIGNSDGGLEVVDHICWKTASMFELHFGTAFDNDVFESRLRLQKDHVKITFYHNFIVKVRLIMSRRHSQLVELKFFKIESARSFFSNVEPPENPKSKLGMKLERVYEYKKRSGRGRKGPKIRTIAQSAAIYYESLTESKETVITLVNETHGAFIPLFVISNNEFTLSTVTNAVYKMWYFVLNVIKDQTVCYVFVFGSEEDANYIRRNLLGHANHEVQINTSDELKDDVSSIRFKS